MCAYNTYSSVMASGKSPGVETAFMSYLCWSVTSYKVSFIVFYIRRWKRRRMRRRLLLSLALYVSEKWRFFCVQNNNNNNCICGFHLHSCIILHIYIIYSLPCHIPRPPLSFLPPYRRPWFTAKFRSSI